jgi:PAB-dependent poly(A)-specific ribonuclease subunit 2
MAIAPTGEGLAFGDADGYVHLWSALEDAKFCRVDGALEMPDPIEPLPVIAWSDSTLVPCSVTLSISKSTE